MKTVFTQFNRKFTEYLYYESNEIANSTNSMKFEEITLRQKKLIGYLQVGPKSYEEIISYLDTQSSIFAMDLRLSKRTLQRDIKNIQRIYHLEIEFDYQENRYRIREDDEFGPIQNLVLSNLDILLALSSKTSFERHVQLQPRNESGSKFLHDILTAVSERKEISFLHRKFGEPELKRNLHPMGIKEYDQRWYIFGHDVDRDAFRIFGLDRISDLNIGDIQFEKYPYDVEEYFRFSFGVEPSVDEVPTEITIKLKNSQANFLKTVPLHYSQKIISEDKDTTSFKFLLVPKHNFIMKLLSFASDLLLIEPPSLRDTVIEKLNKCQLNLNQEK